MSDLMSQLPRPVPPRGWREKLASMAEGLGLGPGRLVVGAAAIVLLVAVGWRIMSPPAEAPEMRLPFAQSASAPGGSGAPGGEAGGGAPGTGGSAGPATSTASGPGTGAARATAAARGDGPDRVVVHVAGAVASPGVQRLPAGARVVDAVEAAGGPTAEADLDRLNLAAPLADGQQVYVVRVGEEPPAPPGGIGAGGAGAGGGTAALVDVNTAASEQLETLPGVGPATAAAIIAHRQEHGPFTSVEQLIEVRGIGEVKLAELRDLVTVS
ncbi:MAG TPA: helix-hairpin-helix domain-containing protein [Acidimicrobiales bacterium]